MTILDFSTTNTQITDEVINVSDSNPIKLNHDVFYNKTGKLVVIRTAAGGGGTLLTESTDYDVGGAFPDSAFPTSISPDVGYTTIAITNATYHDTDLYVSYYPITDLMTASRANEGFLPSGFIMPFGGTSAPAGWLTCDGSAVKRGVYQSLFDAIGTTWGVGDGSTTFNLPDLRGAFLRGAGDGTINARTKSGGSVGDYTEDQMQLITGETGPRSDQGFVDGLGGASAGAFSVGEESSQPGGIETTSSSGFDNLLNFDSGDSPDARTSTNTDGETYPYHAVVKYCIKT